MILNKILTGIATILMLCATAYGYETRLLSEIPLKGNASAIAVSTGADVAAVVSAPGKTLTIIDTLSFALKHDIQLPASPEGLAIHKGSNKAIVLTAAGSLLLYDLDSGELAKTITTGTAIYSIAVDEQNNRALLGGDNGVSIVDLVSENTLATFSSPGKNIHLFLGKTGLAIVSRDENGSKLRLLDMATGVLVAETPLSGEVISVGMDESLDIVLVTLAEQSGILQYGANTLNALDMIPTGKKLQIISINSSTHTVVLADTLDGSLSIADLSRKTIAGTIALYGQVGPLIVDTAQNRVLAAHDQSLMVIQLENPIPKLTGLIPLEKSAGAEGFPLTVTGEMFVKSSRTSFGGTLFDSKFENNELLSAFIPAEKLLMPGEVPVYVANPPPGGGVSNELTFKVLTPAPQLSAISPATVPSGGAAFTLRVEGKNFLPLAAINLSGKKLATNFVSSTVLEALVDASSISVRGSYPVSVTNNGSLNFTSNALSLTVASAEEAALAAGSANGAAAASLETGSLEGRILNTGKKPLQGVTIKFKNQSVQTDSNGNFVFEGLPAGKRTLLIDGSTASEVGGRYPVLPIDAEVKANQRNAMPFTPHLHRQKARNFVNINPSKETILTDSEVPGFEMRIPAGVKITGWDGQANKKVSVRTVPTDRLPIKPLPQNIYARSVHMFYFDKIGGGKPDQPIPIKAANDLRLLPGEKAILLYYDESPIEGNAPNDWAIAGTATVSPDGRYIFTDPGVGIPKFCCGATALASTLAPQDNTSNDPRALVNEPVDASTGYFLHEHTDLVVPGIIPVEIKRFYRNIDGGVAVQNTTNGLGTFGKGMYSTYDWWLGTYSDMLRLTRPGGYQNDFALQADGSYTNSVDPNMRGAKVTVNADSTKTLRMRDGWKYTFDTSGNLVTVADRNNNTLTINRSYGSHDEGGRISSITTAEGRVINFNATYVGGNFMRIESISDDAGRSVRYTYETDPFNPYPRLKQVESPDGSSLQYGYDATSGFMTTITNGRGIVELTNAYDPSYRVTQQVMPDGGTFSYDYTVAGGYVTETTVTNPNGAQTTLRFNNYAYVSSITNADGTTTFDIAPGSNEELSITDPLNRTTSYSYFATTDARNGLIQSITDPLYNSTAFDYETTYGLLKQITGPLGKITTIAYSPAGSPPVQAVIRDPLQHATTINYNAFGLPASIVDANNNATLFFWNPGNRSQLTGISDPLGNAVNYTYDTVGRVAAVTDAKGATTLYGYDPMGRVTSITDPLNNITRAVYDGNGNLAFLLDAKQNSIQYEYDNRDRISKMTDQLGRYETYAYYGGAEITPTTGTNLKSYTDRKGQTSTFNQYDPMNRLKTVTFGDSSTITYLYDAIGRATGSSDSISGAIGYTYNDFGCATQSACSGRGLDRISRETTPFGTIDYTWDKNYQRASMSVSGEPAVSYTHDDAGRLINIAGSIGGQQRIYSLGYDDGNRRISLQLPLASGTDYVTTVYDYDIANRLTGILLQGGAVTIDNLAYTYDPNGNRTSFTKSVTQPLSPTVNNTSHDDANEMLAYNGKTIAYDQNGNLQTRTDSCGTTTFTWDARNRLTAINGFKPDCSALSASFSYDTVNRRTAKTINGVTTQYLYDGWDVIQETTSGIKTNYIRTLNIDEPLTRTNETTTRHYLKDALGSVIGLTDDTGALTTSYAYDAFGNVTTGEASDNPFQFTGRENDGTGLYHYRLRNYSPEMQRFISEDPIRLAGGGINFYSMTGNDPVNRIDPLGLWTVSIGVSAGGMFGAIGGGGGTAFNVGYSNSEGLSTSLTGTVGGGAVTGIGAGVGFNLAATNASSVDQLLGTSVEASRGFGAVAATGIAGSGYYGGALSFGLGGKTIVPSKGAGIVTNTSAIAQWEQHSGFSFFKAGSGCK